MAAGADEDAFHVRIEFGEVSSGLSTRHHPAFQGVFPPRRCFPKVILTPRRPDDNYIVVGYSIQ